MKKNNRVYGVVGIRSIMSNWNADFTGRPKTVSNGDIFGSDKAFKYPIKRMWMSKGEKVLYVRSYKVNDNAKPNEGDVKSKIQPKELNERYSDIFGAEITAKTPSKEILKNLFSSIDVMSFGATFASLKNNLSITGAVQVGQGYNLYKGTIVDTQDILSPFRNSAEGKEEALATSKGTKITVNEAHYFYPISVNPSNYDDYVKLGIDGFEGYTEEAYQKFKAGCLVAATAFNTNSKSGCENEFALFVNCKPNSKLYLANLDNYIVFEKCENGKCKISLEKIAQLLKAHTEEIENIEVYYNEVIVDVDTAGLDCELKNLY